MSIFTLNKSGVRYPRIIVVSKRVAILLNEVTGSNGGTRSKFYEYFVP